MLGHVLVTKQTGSQGSLVQVPQTPKSDLIFFQKLLVAKRYQVKRELYVAFLLDRGFQGLVMVASQQGCT
jgi:succinyl-CoA synthetase beta subunit